MQGHELQNHYKKIKNLSRESQNGLSPYRLVEKAKDIEHHLNYSY